MHVKHIIIKYFWSFENRWSLVKPIESQCKLWQITQAFEAVSLFSLVKSEKARITLIFQLWKDTTTKSRENGQKFVEMHLCWLKGWWQNLAKWPSWLHLKNKNILDTQGTR